MDGRRLNNQFFSGGHEDHDELNDDTFGDGPISDNWKPDHGKNELPDFFRMTGQSSSILDGGLEPEGLETLEEEGIPLEGGLEDEGDEIIQYSTANRNHLNQDNDFEYFIDDPQLEFQMDSLTEFDDDEQMPYETKKPMSASLPIANKEWLKPSVSGSPGGDSIWGGSPSTRPGARMPETKAPLPQDNPLAKFFGGTIPIASEAQPASQQADSGPRVSGVLSVEELEARLRNSRISNQQIQQTQSQPIPQHTPYNPMMHNQPSIIQIHQQIPQQISHQVPPHLHQNQGPKYQQQQPVVQAPQTQVPQRIQQHQAQQPPQTQSQPQHLFSPDQFPTLSKNPQPISPQEPPSFPINIMRNITPYQSPQSQTGTSPPRQQRTQNMQYRARWKEPKKMMSAYEIDSIIRMQEFQLLSGNNPFAEDFYFIMSNRRRSQDISPMTHHKPLYESNTKVPVAPIKRAGIDPLEGALGRIPSHSVRAPRPLLQLKQSDSQEAITANMLSTDAANSNTSSKAIQNLLLSIESGFQLVIDIEDIDVILRSSGENATHFNINHIRQKREDLTNELYRALHVFQIPIGVLSQKVNERDADTNIFQEDELFISWTLVHKGRKLIVRALPILYQEHVMEIYFLYMRNFGALISSPRIEMDLESTNKLFALLFNIVTACAVPHTIMALQTILISHNEVYLIKILQSKFGLPIVQALLKRAHDLNLSSFGREDMVPPEVQRSPLHQAGMHWRDTMRNLMLRILGKWIYIFQSEIGSSNRIWEFFAVLVININQQEKQQLLSELRGKIIATPMNATLGAFLQLAGLNPDLLVQQQQGQRF